ncbi:MAG: hypothetical protein IT464_06010 [Planctomycetes bacterium]|nr:hypothetical protein [Planctomycetota bacterium]
MIMASGGNCGDGGPSGLRGAGLRAVFLADFALDGFFAGFLAGFFASFFLGAFFAVFLAGLRAGFLPPLPRADCFFAMVVSVRRA